MKKLVSLFIVSIVFFVGIGKAQQTIEGLHFATGNPVAVKMKAGKILEVKNIDKLSDENNKLILAPGFFDNQINGFANVSFSFGGGELTEEGVQKATQALWKRGVTTYLPTLTTNSREILTKNFTVLANAKDDKSLLGSIPGYHLEGPYISPIDGFRGAHSKRFVRKPDWNEFMEFYEASGKDILTVTVAPEIEGAMEFIKKCTDLGIVISLGHHNGTAKQINEAVLNGAKTCTHIGNGCANLINRHDNPLWPQLSNDGLMISIICDGFHLRPEEIRVFSKAKGYDKTIITSDVTKYAGLKPGIYKNIDGDDIELTVDGKIQYPAQQVLAGSASSIEKGIGHAMEVTGCSLADAIGMASANPAKLYGLTDRGTLEVGKRADLVLFTMEDYVVNVQKTFVKGELVFNASE
jgi:N-acetylglucosamine-6-phosphate deacetylase